VIDVSFRKEIVQTLGVDIYGDTNIKSDDALAPPHSFPAQAQSMNDWYAAQ